MAFLAPLGVLELSSKDLVRESTPPCELVGIQLGSGSGDRGDHFEFSCGGFLKLLHGDDRVSVASLKSLLSLLIVLVSLLTHWLLKVVSLVPRVCELLLLLKSFLWEKQLLLLSGINVLLSYFLGLERFKVLLHIKIRQEGLFLFHFEEFETGRFPLILLDAFALFLIHLLQLFALPSCL